MNMSDTYAVTNRQPETLIATSPGISGRELESETAPSSVGDLSGGYGFTMPQI
jgi:hypothetical protein